MTNPATHHRSRRLSIGIVGCGEILSAHTEALAKLPELDLRGLYDIDGALAARQAQAIPGAVAFSSLEALIDQCDVVDLCSPPQVHRDAAILSLEAGCDVLIEKPVVDSAAAWREVRAQVESSGRKLCAVYQHKYASHVQCAKRWVEEGAIGDIVGITCEFFVDPIFDPMLAAKGHWSHQLAGGRWFEVLPHLLYLIHMFAGPLEPGGVAVLHRDTAPPGAPAEDVVATLEGRRCLATLHLSARSRLNNRTLFVNGSKGTIEISILGGVATYTSLPQLRSQRGVGLMGLPFLEAAAKLTQWLPDRIRHVTARRAPSEHQHLIEAFTHYLKGAGPSPTPISEIDSVFGCCAAIGEAIDARLNAKGAPTSSAQ